MARRNSFELDPDSHPLAPAVIAFNRGNGWYRAQLGRPERGQWIGLSELSSDKAGIARRLTQLELAYGGRAGYSAASLIQQVAHPLVSLTAWCMLVGQGIPDISPHMVWLRQHPQGLFDRVAISGELVMPSSLEETATAAGAMIVDSLSPLIETIRLTRRVGLAGLWHGVSDLVARTLLGAAAVLDSVETGMAAAEATLTRAPKAIRATPRWHKDQVTGMWFSLRSVCCLAYTGTSGIYCDTCPLLNDDEIRRRLALNTAGAS
jgi:hypothetical protein